MQNMNSPPQISETNLLDIAFEMRVLYGWKQSDTRLKDLVKTALPYVNKALKYTHEKAVNKAQESEPDAIARKVLKNFYHDGRAVHLLMFGDNPNGDERNETTRACEELIRGMVYKRFSWLVKCRDIDDIVNDCWIDALEGLHSFLYLSRLHSWIVSVALNRCRRIGKQCLAEKNRRERFQEYLEQSNATQHTPIPVDSDEESAYKELQESLREEIRQICQKMNRSKKVDLRTRINIAEDKFIRGMKNKEIADKYGVKLGTVDSTLKRIRDKIPKERVNPRR
jgi:RNA polymerase sigma factor (sigma-70 family)